jgi:uncharacterized protein (TIGR02453 family)
MAQFDGFPRGALPFLKQLARNNNRTWFNANKARYEELIRHPALCFIADMGLELARLSPNFEAVAKKMGGSLMRVYRDTRFANDKTPFKTNVGIHFRHAEGRDVHAPGFYVHIEPGNCFLGAGIWHPEAAVLNAIRAFIADNPNAWKQATRARTFARDWALVGDSLSRPPRGYPADHELIDDLKRKDFIACANFDDGLINERGLVKHAAQSFKRAADLMSYLCMAVEVAY